MREHVTHKKDQPRKHERSASREAQNTESESKSGLNSSTGINKRLKREKSNSRLRRKLSEAIGSGNLAIPPIPNSAAKEYDLCLSEAPSSAFGRVIATASAQASSYRSAAGAPPASSHFYSNSIGSEEGAPSSAASAAAFSVYSCKAAGQGMKHSGSYSSLSYRGKGGGPAAGSGLDYNPNFMAQFAQNKKSQQRSLHVSYLAASEEEDFSSVKRSVRDRGDVSLNEERVPLGDGRRGERSKGKGSRRDQAEEIYVLPGAKRGVKGGYEEEG